VIADLNGDGKPDLILTYTIAETSSSDPSGIAIYLNNGTGIPYNNVTPMRLLVGQSIEAVTVADLNGDGNLDLVVSVSDASLVQSDLYVYINSGSATAPFGTPETLMSDTDLGGGCLSIAVGDVDGDGHPDLVFGCTPPAVGASAPAKPAVGAIYLSNGTATPFANVTPTDIPATSQSSYARGVAIGTLVPNATPSVLIVDTSLAGSQTGAATYVPTQLDQNPVAQNDTAVVAINKSIPINVLANDTASTGQTLNATSVTVAPAPAHGTATVDSTTGAITYVPASDYSGADSFQYGVQDNLGAQSNSATVTVTIQPAPGRGERHRNAQGQRQRRDPRYIQRHEFRWHTRHRLHHDHCCSRAWHGGGIERRRYIHAHRRLFWPGYFSVFGRRQFGYPLEHGDGVHQRDATTQQRRWRISELA
jgi:hypothetical protein